MWALHAAREAQLPAQGRTGLQATVKAGRGRKDHLWPHALLLEPDPRRPHWAAVTSGVSHPCPGRDPRHRGAYLYRLLGQRASRSPQTPARERRIRARGTPGSGVNLVLTPCHWHPGSSFGQVLGTRGLPGLVRHIHSHTAPTWKGGHIGPGLQWGKHDAPVSRDMGAQHGPAM